MDRVHGPHTSPTPRAGHGVGNTYLSLVITGHQLYVLPTPEESCPWRGGGGGAHSKGEGEGEGVIVRGRGRCSL